MSILVDIVIPVYNEEKTLEKSINRLKSFLNAKFPYNWRIIIADNASFDRTAEIGQRLQKIHQNVYFLHLDKKGRGRALRKVWLESKADIVSYMDVDLSTSLVSFPKLIEAIVNGSDIAFGSRLLNGSRTYRSFKREFLSHFYSIFLKVLLWTHFKDAQCGFKATSRRTAYKIVPQIKNNEWFFDTELLVIGEKLGLKLTEIPVEWNEEQYEGRVSTVKILNYIIENFIGTLRLLLTKKSWLRHFSKNEKRI